MFKDGSEAKIADLKVVPNLDTVVGLLFHLSAMAKKPCSHGLLDTLGVPSSHRIYLQAVGNPPAVEIIVAVPVPVTRIFQAQ